MRALAELVRAPAALSVPGDVLSGAAAAGALRGGLRGGWRGGRGPAGLAAASVCLYWAGMALNDYADRRLDAVERPERPIPSGRVRPGTALAVAAGLTGAGLALAGTAGGRRSLRAAVPLAAAVWAYDLLLKPTPAAAAAMALCRGLDVLLGATAGGRGRWRAALPAACAIGAHTFAVTLLSRGEAAGATPRRVGLAAAAGAPVVPLVLAEIAGRTGGTHRSRAAGRAVAAGLLGAYAAAVGGAQAAAVREPSAERIRRAVGAGVLGLIPLQAALTAARGHPLAGLALVPAHPLARRLARKVSPT
ncbi:transferase [Actinomadura sp. NBRC 104425]|uniref:SCO3242 family prenyltransferase n=1 Tax=Actinomadura sp. NBRC 104425 TaxID=3032204 RepID=UPI0024A4B287|nr:UbiA family prenyltransferase [Actinomadura sp. NBRC 104425]GLZ11780.1 transferase [Actinomadura sp. NBRC 104425]